MEGNLIAEAKKAGIKHIVKQSFFGADRPEIALSRWHRDSEKNLEASGIAISDWIRENVALFK